MAVLHHGVPVAGRSTALPSPAYCFASVIMWTENKNVTISERFICLSLTMKRHWRPVLRATTKKGHQLFLRKKVHLVTWLEDFLTLKWSGTFTVLAPPLHPGLLLDLERAPARTGNIHKGKKGQWKRGRKGRRERCKVPDWYFHFQPWLQLLMCFYSLLKRVSIISRTFVTRWCMWNVSANTF